MKLLLLTFLFSICLSNLVFAQNSGFFVHIQDIEPTELTKKIEDKSSLLLSALSKAASTKKKPNFDSDFISKDAQKQISELWKSSVFTIIDSSNIVQMSTLINGNHEIRPIPIQFEKSSKTEELVLVFNQNAIVVDVRIAIELHKYNSLSKGRNVIDFEIRQSILSFLEDYRTAYTNKNKKFLQKVFSDQALIIVGKEIKTKKDDGSLQKQVEFLKFTKKEYLNRVEQLFKKNVWIDIEFQQIGILEHPLNEQIYGVNLTQSYRSDTYSDEGYLFLLIDFRKKDNPIIHVRTWQPKNSISENEAFALGDLEIF